MAGNRATRQSETRVALNAEWRSTRSLHKQVGGYEDAAVKEDVCVPKAFKTAETRFAAGDTELPKTRRRRGGCKDAFPLVLLLGTGISGSSSLATKTTNLLLDRLQRLMTQMLKQNLRRYTREKSITVEEEERKLGSR